MFFYRSEVKERPFISQPKRESPTPPAQDTCHAPLRRRSQLGCEPTPLSLTPVMNHAVQLYRQPYRSAQLATILRPRLHRREPTKEQTHPAACYLSHLRKVSWPRNPRRLFGTTPNPSFCLQPARSEATRHAAAEPQEKSCTFSASQVMHADTTAIGIRSSCHAGTPLSPAERGTQRRTALRWLGVSEATP